MIYINKKTALSLYRLCASRLKRIYLVKELFRATRAGLNAREVIKAVGDFSQRYSALEKGLTTELPHVRQVFAKNLFLLGPDGSLKRPSTWKDVFDILEKSIAKTKASSLQGKTSNDLKSLSCIEKLIENLAGWHRCQDQRLLPVFEALGRLDGLDNALMRLTPEDFMTAVYADITSMLQPGKGGPVIH